MVKNALLIDIYEASAKIRDAFMNSVELNGNPFYHRWYIDNNMWDKESQKNHDIVDVWLKSLNLSSKDIVIITGGW